MTVQQLQGQLEERLDELWNKFSDFVIGLVEQSEELESGKGKETNSVFE